MAPTNATYVDSSFDLDQTEAPMSSREVARDQSREHSGDVRVHAFAEIFERSRAVGHYTDFADAAGSVAAPPEGKSARRLSIYLWGL